MIGPRFDSLFGFFLVIVLSISLDSVSYTAQATDVQAPPILDPAIDLSSSLTFDITHDPEAEARRNFQKGRVFVYSAHGYTLHYPGLSRYQGDYLAKRFGSRLLKHTSDALVSEAHRVYVDQAVAYGKVYNLTTRALLTARTNAAAKTQAAKARAGEATAQTGPTPFVTFYDLHDPAAEARRNFQKRRIWIYSLNPHTHVYPGIDNRKGVELADRFRSQSLEGTWQPVTSLEQLAAITRAEAYAKTYNLTTLDLLAARAVGKTDFQKE